MVVISKFVPSGSFGDAANNSNLELMNDTTASTNGTIYLIIQTPLYWRAAYQATLHKNR